MSIPVNESAIVPDTRERRFLANGIEEYSCSSLSKPIKAVLKKAIQRQVLSRVDLLGTYQRK
jgi:hypothetical protein